MSDHDAAPDPIDQAYVQAEALLSDEGARSARRERVLAAVAREPATPLVAALPKRPARRRGGWLAAASLTALGAGVFVASQIYQPAPHQTGPATPTAPTSAVPTSAAPTSAAPTPVTPTAVALAPARRGIAALPRPSVPPAAEAPA